ncbi:DUF1963 domain-containing protein, partial [Streptomyces sp. F8]
PAGLDPYPEVALTGQPGLSVPTSDAPNVRAAFGEVGNSLAWRRHPVNARPFDSALRALDTHPSRSGHRLGGHPVPVQEPVEWEIARGVLGPDAAGQDSRLDDEAAAWVLLAQIDTDGAGGGPLRGGRVHLAVLLTPHGRPTVRSAGAIRPGHRLADATWSIIGNPCRGGRTQRRPSCR